MSAFINKFKLVSSYGKHGCRLTDGAPYPGAAKSSIQLQLNTKREIRIPASMHSTSQVIRQVEALSLQHYEGVRRSRKIHVFVDLSNVAIGAQVGP
jgi:hypothetical protein